MTSWANAELLVHMLDRELKFMLAQKDERRVLLLTRWLAFIERESQLSGLLDEISVETDRLLKGLSAADGAVRQTLVARWRENEASLRAHLAPDMTQEELHVYCHLDEFESKALRIIAIELPRLAVFDEDESETAKLVNALHHWALWVVQRNGEAGIEVPPAIPRLLNETRSLQLRVQYLQRRLRIAIESMAGPATYRLRWLAEETNPVPPAFAIDQDGDDNGMQIAVFDMMNEFAGKVHGREVRKLRDLEADDVSRASSDCAEDLALVTQELQRRLLAGRSRLTLMQRYAARCEGFEARALREICQQNSQNAERELTLDFAKFLFDQGLTPLLDPTIGGLRPDVIGPSSSNLLYVEAKQYGEDWTRAKIIDAYRQVWSTWGRLRKAHPVLEAFLLVFRRGGPRVELPEAISFRGLRLYSVLVDLAERAGSREDRPPVSFDQAELLPMQSDVNRPGVRRRVGSK